MNTLRACGGTLRTATYVCLAWSLSQCVCQAASPTAKLSGALFGSVQDNGGIPQMGAVVQLFNRMEKPLGRVVTNARGEFGFDSLIPDVYMVRVSLPSFVPALKRNISIHPGLRSVLSVNLATVMSSVELLYSAPNPGVLMNQNWEWVLRGSMETRPVLRILPDWMEEPEERHGSRAWFSGTRALVRVASGETNPFAVIGNQPDLGTTFAVATSLRGSNQLRVSGNIGFAGNSELPTTGFRTSFSRAGDFGPEVKLTVQQVSLPRGGVLNSPVASAPALRTMSVSMLEEMRITEALYLQYGASLDSVAFMDRLNYVSPFARLSYDLGGLGVIDAGFSSGAPPVELLNRPGEADTDFQSDLAALSLLPRISMRDGQSRVQRTQNMEIGYRLKAASRTYSLGMYKETVGNGALTMSVPDGAMYAQDLLPELSSSSSVFNIGRYSRTGYTVAVTQALGDIFTATLAVGRGGVLGTDGQQLQTDDPDELRSRIIQRQRHWIRARMTGNVPVTGTKFAASYEWTDFTSLVPGHVFLTQRIYPETGLNVRLRQPLPGFGLPGRMEATAELRNLLAQGYLPVTMADGRRLVLAHSPRAVRGGVSFIF